MVYNDKLSRVKTKFGLWITPYHFLLSPGLNNVWITNSFDKLIQSTNYRFSSHETFSRICLSDSPLSCLMHALSSFLWWNRLKSPYNYFLNPLNHIKQFIGHDTIVWQVERHQKGSICHQFLQYFLLHQLWIVDLKHVPILLHLV